MKMDKKIIIAIVAIVIIAAIAVYYTTQPPTTGYAVSAEDQALDVVDQELGSAVQGISDLDVQSAMT